MPTMQETPVRFLGHEDLDFVFTIADHLGGHGLDAAGAEALFHLGPQDGADLIAHEAVQHAAGLLGVDKVHVDGAGIFYCGVHFFARTEAQLFNFLWGFIAVLMLSSIA